MKITISKNRDQSGMTLSDLMTVVATVSLLMLTQVPVLSTNKGTIRSFKCQSNLREINRAWSIHSQDNNGILLSAGGVVPNRTNWMTGYIAYNDGEVGYSAITKSPLAPYLAGRPDVWRCPSDLSIVRDNSGKFIPRARSYSMNDAFGGGLWLPPQVWATYDELSDIHEPSKIWTFMDEHPDSINDGAFAVGMVRSKSTSGRIIDFPASHHRGAASIVFADGHSELHKWKGKTIQPPVRFNNNLTLNVDAGDSLIDLKWLSSRTSVLRSTGKWE